MKHGPYQLSLRTQSILISLSEAMIDEPDDFQITERNTLLIERFQNILREFPPLLRFASIMGMLLFDRLTLFWGVGFKRFARLNLEKRKLYYEKWMNSRISVFRDIIKGLRGMILLVYFCHKDVWKYIGYDPVGHVGERIAIREKLLKRNA